MAKVIAKMKIINGKMQLTRIGEGEKKIKMGCCYKLYAAFRKVNGA
ncbi:hypothetical protein [Desulfotomaculum sp. 1211_IL3151]